MAACFACGTGQEVPGEKGTGDFDASAVSSAGSSGGLSASADSGLPPSSTSGIASTATSGRVVVGNATSGSAAAGGGSSGSASVAIAGTMRGSAGLGGSGGGGASTGASGSAGGGSGAGSSGGASGSGSGAGSGASGSGAGTGSTPTGSSGATSGATSGGATSGSSAGPLCSYGAAVNRTGSFTWYYFGQGTYQQNGMYLTACGYQGTESAMIDSVSNIATTLPASSHYFAAIPGSSGFNTVSSCGACVQVVNGNTSIIATIIDECPTDGGQNPLCTMPGHLDLSYAAWKALGYARGDPSGTTWKFVSCPVTGTITTRLKSGNVDQLYIENTTFPIVAATMGGQPLKHLSYGAWQLPGGAPASGASLNLTDAIGHMVTITVPPGGGATNKQLPSACQ